MRVATLTAMVVLAVTAAWTPLKAEPGEEPVAAPEWEVSEWINGDPGSLADQRGSIVLVEFFQMWCPACNHFSMPLFKRWEKKYGARDDVVLVSIHTVFEGHDVQTVEKLRGFVASRNIVHPVGVDAFSGSEEEFPVTMLRYRTGGTPHIAIVDRNGKLRFSRFGGFDPEPVEELIDRLLDEPVSPS